MRDHHGCKKAYLGASDIATLIFVGGGNSLKNNSFEWVNSYPVHFGEDGSYDAYFVTDDDVMIPDHYSLVAKFDHWMKVYDDNDLTLDLNAGEIEVYRAGSFGCIIRVKNLNHINKPLY